MFLALWLAARADDGPPPAADPPATEPVPADAPDDLPAPTPPPPARLAAANPAPVPGRALANVGMGGVYVGPSLMTVGFGVAIVGALMCFDTCLPGTEGVGAAGTALFGSGLVLFAVGPGLVGAGELQARGALGGSPTLARVAVGAGVVATGAAIWFLAGEQFDTPGPAVLGLVAASTGYVVGGVELGRLTSLAEGRGLTVRWIPPPNGLGVAGTF
jgi:hypothetical protein